MKIQAKQYYDQYKEFKKSFVQERLQLNEEKRLIVEYENKLLAEKEKIDVMLEEDLREKVYIKNKVGIQNSVYIDQDIDEMVDILNTLKFENDIYQGLDSKETEILQFVLNKYKLNRNEENLLQTFKNNYKNEQEENLISKIEESVNDLLQDNRITEIKIKQLNTSEFQFNDYKTKVFYDNGIMKVKEISKENNNKEAEEKFKLENLETINLNKNDDYVVLEDWLISKFPFIVNKNIDKTVSRLQSFQNSIVKTVEKLNKKTMPKKKMSKKV
jgi:hypothetical protein